MLARYIAGLIRHTEQPNREAVALLWASGYFLLVGRGANLSITSPAIADLWHSATSLTREEVAEADPTWLEELDHLSSDMNPRARDRGIDICFEMFALLLAQRAIHAAEEAYETPVVSGKPTHLGEWKVVRALCSGDFLKNPADAIKALEPGTCVFVYKDRHGWTRESAAGSLL
jgi:hypothetical protein